MPSTRLLPWPRRGSPLVMGILNITPDSFSDGGHLYDVSGLNRDKLLRRAEAMIAEGVSIFDVGGESTRPGALGVSEQQELARVVPVVEWLLSETDIPVSVDTSSPAVMREVLDLGAAMVNDVRALQRPGAMDVVADKNVPVCIMHMPDEPGQMQKKPEYSDVVMEVTHFLRERADNCQKAGISRQNIVIDPGFGFGKNLQHNLALFRALPELVKLDYPVLVGVSRKSMIGEILQKPVEGRVYGSIAMALLAAQNGAAILRVHDVGATVDALKIWQAAEAD